MKNKKLKTFEEYTDYRNVTGYGTMGQSGDQNTGPSFNKGPDSATYNRPDVIGTEDISMEDPYFSDNKKKKLKRIRKNKHVEKTRKNKSKYLNDIDKDTQSKMIKENSSFNRLKPKGETEIMKEVFEKFEKDKNKICDYLNEKYKDEIIEIKDVTNFFGSIAIKDFNFYPVDDYYKAAIGAHYNISYSINTKEATPYSRNDETHVHLINDTITPMELYVYEPKRVFSEEDPYGEEEWDD